MSVQLLSERLLRLLRAFVILRAPLYLSRSEELPVNPLFYSSLPSSCRWEKMLAA